MLNPASTRPLLLGHRANGLSIWQIRGGSAPVVEPPPATLPVTPPPAPSAPPVDAPDGFPANTPLAEMSVEQREAYWKHQARKHEGRAESRKDYDDIKAERDRLKAATQTDSDKAIEAARAEGRAEAAKETNVSTVKALLEGALAMRGKTVEQVADLLKVINPEAFITDGAPDTKAILRHADTLAGPAGRGPDFGAGNRGRQSSPGKGEAGRAEALRRHPKQQ